MYSEFMFVLLLLLTFFLIEVVYFKIADRFNIIDKPNERSSHSTITIRGGGLVYVFAGLFSFVFLNFQLPFLWVGFLIISILSFIDDIVTLSSKVRMPFQFLGVALMVLQLLANYDMPVWYWIIAVILATGIINAYNFMDGINGITVGYSLIVLLSIYYLNIEFAFVNQEIIVAFVLANLVFGFFNFRKKAKAFAGDVGSVSIAFVIVYLLFALILKTQNLFYILLLAVYGVDSVLTIVYRLKRRENIFLAHRSHLYQWLVKPGPFSHLQMSGIYMATQLLISVGVFYLKDASIIIQLTYAGIVLLLLASTYGIIKSRYAKKYELV